MGTFSFDVCLGEFLDPLFTFYPLPKHMPNAIYVVEGGLFKKEALPLLLIIHTGAAQVKLIHSMISDTGMSGSGQFKIINK